MTSLSSKTCLNTSLHACKLHEQMETMTLAQRVDFLCEQADVRRKVWKKQQYNRHKLKVIIDMNDVTGGVPAIHVWPKPPLTLRGYPYFFEFVVEHDDVKESIGSIKSG